MSILTRSTGITGSMPAITVDTSLPQFSYRGMVRSSTGRFAHLEPEPFHRLFEIG